MPLIYQSVVTTTYNLVFLQFVNISHDLLWLFATILWCVDEAQTSPNFTTMSFIVYVCKIQQIYLTYLSLLYLLL